MRYRTCPGWEKISTVSPCECGKVPGASTCLYRRIPCRRQRGHVLKQCTEQETLQEKIARTNGALRIRRVSATALAAFSPAETAITKTNKGVVWRGIRPGRSLAVGIAQHSVVPSHAAEMSAPCGPRHLPQPSRHGRGFAPKGAAISGRNALRRDSVASDRAKALVSASIGRAVS